jgi:DNA modification methylase
MPESVLDRPTTSHEYLFLLSKNEQYYYDAEAIKERSASNHATSGNKERKFREDYGGNPGHTSHLGFAVPWENDGTRNKRSVWTVSTSPYPEAHYATFSPALIEPCILAGSRPGDIVLDPFAGSGTVGRVAEQYSRRWIGIDLGYQELQAKRLSNLQKVLIP